ncbi:MAG: alkaline phosphatase family protein [Myxococcota bacterium]
MRLPALPTRPWAGALAATVLLASAPACKSPKSDIDVIVLGFDGMDPKFVRRHSDRLPNLMRLAEQGGFSELETVMPPQSPVAWSTVITGMTPGGHGVFDFVHRHPEDVTPFSSMADAIPPEYTLEIGDVVIPLTGGETIPLRKGEAFWQVLDQANVPTTMMKMPTDFPPLPANGGAVSGMGTPDMLGSFGTFQFFSDDPAEYVREEVSGGELYRVDVIGDHVSTTLYGPVNTFYKDEPRTEAAIEIDVDRQARTARLEIGEDVMVLKEGDWSEWVEVDFELVPYMLNASGIVRFFLKEAYPNFKLYASPININPKQQEVPISEPAEFAAEIADAVGMFYTQGMAEETKALSAHVISRTDFIAQANLVYDEEIDIYNHLLDAYKEKGGGFMFYYFSTTDQAGHMLWGDYEEELVPFYERADKVVGHTLDTIDPDTTLMVISDHGFQRFDREVHLNRWLMDEGFLALDDPSNAGPTPGFEHVDWDNTQLYAMGLNGLYFNLDGREDQGVVTEEQKAAIEAELEKKLLAWIDPDTGKNVVLKLYRPAEMFEGGEMEFAPDFLVGFAPPYRMSPATGLGAVPNNQINDNPDEWIGDHCMAHETVPGVLFSNRKITGEKPRLHDVPVSVLTAFGIEPPKQMVGKNVLQTR